MRSQPKWFVQNDRKIKSQGSLNGHIGKSISLSYSNFIFLITPYLLLDSLNSSTFTRQLRSAWMNQCGLHNCKSAVSRWKKYIGELFYYRVSIENNITSTNQRNVNETVWDLQLCVNDENNIETVFSTIDLM